MAGAIQLREMQRKPWRSVTFSGIELVFAIDPPDGHFIVEAKVTADGALVILLFDDVMQPLEVPELTRTADAAEAARFAAELERDARVPDEYL